MCKRDLSIKLYLYIIIFFNIIHIYAEKTELFNEKFQENKVYTILERKFPLWEFGLFNGIAVMPHYVGSDEEKVYAIPLPYLLYRGETFKADRDGVRGIFLNKGNFISDISFFGTPPVTDDNKARKSMKELGPMIETGPSLKYFFTEIDDFNKKIYLDLSIRKCFSFDMDNLLRISSEGYHGGLKFVYKYNPYFSLVSNYSYGATVGLDFANRSFNKFYYDVSIDDATDYRSAYRSHGGYSGVYLSGYLFRKVSNFIKVSIYTRLFSLKNNQFVNSSLVKKEIYSVLGFAVTWKIKQSKKLA